MKVNGVAYRPIWLADDGRTVRIIDQTVLPHRFTVVDLRTLEDAAHAIRAMLVRGAPLIGATAAYGVCLALQDDDSAATLERACTVLGETRPTAVNLRWALDEMRAALSGLPDGARVAAAAGAYWQRGCSAPARRRLFASHPDPRSRPACHGQSCLAPSSAATGPR